MLPHLKRLNVLLAELKRRHVFRAVALYAVAAWAMVEVASTILPVFPIPDPDAVIRIIVVPVVLFFPLVLVLAWAFDLTVQGVQRTEEVEAAPPAVLHFLRSPAFQVTLILLVLLLTGGAGWVSWQLWLRPGVGMSTSPSAGRVSLDPTRLAVLYFDDFSPGGELGYLANGITEALIHDLSQVEALEVISRNGVKPYRELYQRAQRLREDADTLRWSRGDTLAAGQLFLQADSLLARAATLDHEWARPIIARGWLSRARAGLFSASQSRRTPQLLAEGLRFAEEALLRSPGDPEALELRGTIRADLARGGRNEEAGALGDQALEDLNAAVDADPGRVMAWVSQADLLRIRGRFQEASVAAQHALEADPFLINGEMEVLFSLSQVWLDLGEVEKAERFIDAGRRRFPGEPSYPAAKLVLLAGGVSTPGASDTALALVREVEEAYGLREWAMGRLQVAAVLASAGLADSASVLLGDAGSQEGTDPWVQYYAAKVRLNLGEEEHALELLQAFLMALPGRRDYIARDWWWEPLRADPRFQVMVRPPPPLPPRSPDPPLGSSHPGA